MGGAGNVTVVSKLMLSTNVRTSTCTRLKCDAAWENKQSAYWRKQRRRSGSR